MRRKKYQKLLLIDLLAQKLGLTPLPDVVRKFILAKYIQLSFWLS
jgi:hypothetical protein